MVRADSILSRRSSSGCNCSMIHLGKLPRPWGLGLPWSVLLLDDWTANRNSSRRQGLLLRLAVHPHTHLRVLAKVCPTEQNFALGAVHGDGSYLFLLVAEEARALFH